MVQWQPVSSSILILAENADPISEGEAGTEASSMGGKAPTGQGCQGFASPSPPSFAPRLNRHSPPIRQVSTSFRCPFDKDTLHNSQSDDSIRKSEGKRCHFYPSLQQ
jgi:hypothetical protein